MIEITILVAIILILTIIIFKSWNKLEKWKEQLRFIASIITVVSILFAVFVFYHEQNQMKERELENQRVLLEVFTEEIEYNLEITESVEKNRNKLLETDEWPRYHYRTIIIEQVIKYVKIEDSNLRKQLWRAYTFLAEGNYIIDLMPIYIPETKEQYDSFVKLKKEHANMLLDYNNYAKEELLDLKPKIEALIQSSNI